MRLKRFNVSRVTNPSLDQTLDEKVFFYQLLSFWMLYSQTSNIDGWEKVYRLLRLMNLKHIRARWEI